ncbi:MAG: protein-L-isoaspartate O-methyltransferase [Myxococcales bacterium]|nr:protein-L-isoaspartate O-methyltransferase [Myxococcales bacterium]
MSLATSFMAPTNPHSLDAMLAWLENRGIDDRCVLAAMTVVPREPFVAMQAHILDVARRLQALELVGDEHVLQIGMGTGYAAAVLSLLSAHVYATESVPELSSGARERLAAYDFDGVSIACREPEVGWPEHAPYDAIFVAGSVDEVPQALVDQLAIGGRLVVSRRGRLVRVTKRSTTGVTVEELEAAPRGEGN